MLGPSDFIDYMLDEGATDVFLLLIEAVKTPQKFKRVAEKALNAGKPIIVGKIGQTEPGSRAVISHTAALAGATAAYRATFAHYGLIEGRDFDEMLDLAAGFLACGDRLPKGNRIGICTASGGAGVWMADACAAAGLEVPLLDKETRAALDLHLPSYATSQNPVNSTAQGVQKLGYAQFARLVAGSPSVDSVVGVVLPEMPKPGILVTCISSFSGHRAFQVESGSAKLKDFAEFWPAIVKPTDRRAGARGTDDRRPPIDRSIAQARGRI